MATNSDGVTTLLKGFASRVACTKTKERCQILSEVRDCVSTGAVPEAAVKTICRILAQTIPVFADGASRKAVLGLIGVLCAKYRDASVKALCDIIGSYVTETKIFQGKGQEGPPMWCYVGHAYCQGKPLRPANNDLCQPSWHAQGGQSILQGTPRLKSTWKQVEGLWESSLDTAKQLDVSSHALCLIGWLLRYATETKNTEAVANQKKALLDVYIKTVFGGKVKPLVHSLEVSKWLLQHLTHPEFESSILPAIQKAMLRSPENVVQAVSYTIGGVSLDLSQYATELGKNIATQLHAKDETLRLEAISAAENLALQCSDPSAIESLSKHFFAVLGGSEGKLTVVAERTGVLSGIGGLSVNGVSGVTSVQSLVSSVMTLFMPYLQQEAHEGTMVHGLTMLSRWCSKSSTDLPPKLIQWFQKAMTQKQSTAATRNGCIRVMLNALKAPQ
eukprot:XP_011673638.1 PREDICTED: translational activator GCN1-like [Strongylocentrotus purpuratus]